MSRRGSFKGRLEGSVTPHVPLRRKQYIRTQPDEFCKAIARGFVSAKLQHQLALMMRYNRKRPALVLAESTERLKQYLQQVPQQFQQRETAWKILPHL